MPGYRSPGVRFWEKVDRTGDCWLWRSATNHKGYGSFNLGHRGGRSFTVLAHRFVYRLCIGPIPDASCVLHRCDNPPCVNPAHLFLGTHADNARDRDRKGRKGWVAGEENGRAKFSDDDIREVRALRAQGWRLCDIGDAYGIHLSHVSRIARNEVRASRSARPCVTKGTC